jgi:hypothetical protein
VAVLAWWASLPEPMRRVVKAQPELRPIELVILPPSIDVEPRPPEPVEPPPEVEPAPAEQPAPSDASATSPRRPKVTPTTPATPTDPDAPADPVGPAIPTEPGGVALLGLRSGSHSSTATGSLRPTLPPPSVAHGRVVREVGAQQPPPSAFDDGQPRSLEEAGFRRRRNGNLVFRDATGRFTATLGPDGRVKFRDMPAAIARDPMTGASVGIAMPGLAEGLRVASGQELYQQEKKRLLEATFELRLALAVAFARDKVDRRLKSLYRELLDDWNDDGASEAERREALFRRWDECEEGPAVALPGFADAQSSELDDLRRTAGEQARETIERFIRRQLPAGSPQAYSDDELRRLNAGRRSRARFAPYS